MVTSDEAQDDIDALFCRQEAEEERRWKLGRRGIAHRWQTLNASSLVNYPHALGEGEFDRDDTLSDAQVNAYEEHKRWLLVVSHQMILLSQAVHVSASTMRLGLLYLSLYYVQKAVALRHPLLVMGTCLFLASKVDEATLDLDRLWLMTKSVAKRTSVTVDFTASDIVATEPVIMMTLDHVLLFPAIDDAAVYFIREFAHLGEQASLEVIAQDVGRAVNDAFRTDLVLRYPLHVIAVAAVLLHYHPLNDMQMHRDGIYSTLTKHGINVTEVGQVALQLRQIVSGPFDEHHRHMEEEWHVITATLCRYQKENLPKIQKWHLQAGTWRVRYRHVLEK